MKNTLARLSLLLMLASCGGGNSKNSSSGIEPQKEVAPVTESAIYLGTLFPLNTHLSGYIPHGQAQIKISNDNFQVKTVLDDDAFVIHSQSIYLGTSCPTDLDDANGDGIVDILEMERSTGLAIIPLDSDLTNQIRGIFLKGRGMTYKNSVNLKDLMNSLVGTDENPADNIVKLESSNNFGFENKVIVIHGISKSKILPSSVQTTPTMTTQASIPVVCGILHKIESSNIPR